MFIDLSLSLPVDHPLFQMAIDDMKSPLSMGHIGTHLDTHLQRPIPVDWCDRRGVLVDARKYGRSSRSASSTNMTSKRAIS